MGEAQVGEQRRGVGRGGHRHRRWGQILPLHVSLLLLTLPALVSASSFMDNLKQAAAKIAQQNAARARVVARPCKGPSIVVDINSEADFAKRVNYPATRVVYLMLRQDITIAKGLLFAQNYSCTIFTSTTGKSFTVRMSNIQNPALKIEYTNNVLVNRVNFYLPLTNANFLSYNCSFPEVTNGDFIGVYSCPAIWIYQVFAVQVTQGTSYGRIDLFQTQYSRVDSMKVTVAAKNFPANIRVSLSGDGPNLKRANIWITNNDVYAHLPGVPSNQGANTGIMVLRGGVGVNVYNNRLHNFVLASLQIGHGQTNVGDAMLNYVNNNEILHDFGQLGNGTPMDIGGIYIDTHWVNPGNYLRCNYVYRGGHCLYLDWVTSATVVDGLVCYKTADGLKVNTGKNNVVTGMIMIDTFEPAAGYISCQNYWENNCGHYPGSVWAQKLNDFYQTQAIKKTYPYLNDFCSRTSIRGINCNLGTDSQHSAKVTGNCSGLPTENYIEIVTATTDGSSKKAFFQDNCQPFPSVYKLNTIKYFATSIAAARFNSVARQDFGLLRPRLAHPIKQRFPSFRSCPRAAIGPKRVAFKSYMNLWNINLPQTRATRDTMAHAAQANPHMGSVESALRSVRSHSRGGAEPEVNENMKNPYDVKEVNPQDFGADEDSPDFMSHARKVEYYSDKSYSHDKQT